ncbi:transglycosylase domain-containing protein [Cytophagaceae bacterium DM2B3-1]|uniref:Transglycosylase domain-containing protein n=1 Tax=Xanthocytophaga flava TaxID=3048013 RepID=A0AAE3QY27_9BACT|nr:transglycosylase domain-containing protein [Xanthocytophaga flavus]MDJ1485290.1 transglycosylase domain-containing protein [Xanthocytophaga flavus]MDJ1494633.1 transglycosylase domain-containing protein [Xanthocytophaga flavus]
MIVFERGTYRLFIRIVWISFVAFWALLLFYIFAVSVDLFGMFGPMPDLKTLENPKNELASEVYSADGILLGKYFVSNRSPIEYEDISPNLINALVATEDVRFERHSGIDFKGTFAIISSFISLDPRGSSTISQQLAKNLYKTRGEGSEGSLYSVRPLRLLIIKTKEWMTAIKIERSYTKREIITMYLNTVDFGSNAYGIKTAAQTFFRKKPAELTIPESAVLVGLLKSTTAYNPKRNPDRAKIRRNTVMQQMVKYSYLTEIDYEKYKEQPIEKMIENYTVENHSKGLATYFRSVLQRELQRWCRENGYDIYRDGLKIYTTIDSRMQAHAEEAVAQWMKQLQVKFNAHWKGKNPWVDENRKEIANFIENAAKGTPHYRELQQAGIDTDEIWQEMNKPVPMRIFSWQGEKDTVMSPLDSIRYYKRFLQTGLLSMVPATGEIKAWVGGLDFKYFQYDHVKQGRRQPGSSFKPIVYATALDNGYTPCYTVVDAPITFAEDVGGKPWTPNNSDGPPSGRQFTLRQAMGRSVNTISAYLVKNLGPQKVVDYAKRLGITSPLEAVPSIALGTQDVSIYELLGVYSTFVNSGIWNEPKYITRIEDKNGNVIWEPVPRNVEVLSEETAYLMTYMLQGAVQERGGTAQGLHRYKIWKDYPEIGAKTGTTQNHSDGWFMGVMPNLATGIWIGGDDRSIHFRDRTGEGGKMSLPLWGMYMEKVVNDPQLDFKPGKFKKPATLSVTLDCSAYQITSATDSTKDKTYQAPSAKDLENEGFE